MGLPYFEVTPLILLDFLDSKSFLPCEKPLILLIFSDIKKHQFTQISQKKTANLSKTQAPLS